MVFSIFLVLFVTVCHHLVDGCDYSSLGADHTMCKYNGQGCAITKREFSAGEKSDMVKAHNEMRQKVAKGQEGGQPSASNMKELHWDDELATIAQRWADQCKFGHDTNRNSKKYSYVGQNVYIFWNSAPIDKVDSQKAVMSWYNEVTKPGFSSSNIKPYQFGSGTGHYTQLVWAATEAVGCGVSMYKDASNGMNTQLIVCNYGPGGNMKGGAMYETGPACSKCPSGCSTSYPGLCK